ncbi:hypothetical protein [Sphingobacterium sp. UME9]|uniref:hypothetical protein n=1 Tax=Sphingobacterium sp. UME9 TaxID=1862316 RepID=UPI0016033F3E|nr:hypothetical protein [Sphingobacterium sp. UME9]MBB1644951.1 hypothetical protein [Sphingobacterium sp. UME9]
MKIVGSISSIYNKHLVYYEILKKKVDQLIIQNKDNRWHYESRVKQLESFATKFESGRFTKEKILEDLFACTVVVKNINDVKLCYKMIEDNFVIKTRRPNSDKFTHKDSFSFPFDDLRLYLTLKDDNTGKFDPIIYSLIFEIQVKTFLQHAWSIATHDLIYKTDRINWAKERIAYHVKASLEQAELTIDSFEVLSANNTINKENAEVQRINEIIAYTEEIFVPERLPKDKRRLANNIDILLTNLNLNIKILRKIITQENLNGRGAAIQNLSPFQIIIKSIYQYDRAIIAKFLTEIHIETRYRLLVTPEMEINLEDIPNIIKKRLIVCN